MITNKELHAGVYTFGMEQKNLWAIVGLLGALFVVMWVALIFGGPATPNAVTPGATLVVEAAYTPSGPLEVVYAVDGMTNSYSGKITLPACNTLATGIVSSGSDPVTITLALRVITNDPACADASPVEQPFSISFTPGVKTEVTFGAVTLNGKPIDFTLIEPKKK